MHLLPLALALATAVAADAAPGPAVAPVPVPAPGDRGGRPPREAPALVGVEPAAPARLPVVAPAPISPAPAGAPAEAPVRPIAPAPPLPQAAVEKLGQGDRAYLERDYRSALFAYQDAVYLAPRSPVARVKLGRAYLALRYPAQAIAQAEQALAVAPGDAEALRLAEEARNAAPRPAPPAAPPRPAANAVASPPPGTNAVVSTPPASATPQPRVFRFTPEPEPAERVPAAAEAALTALAPAAVEPARAAAPATAEVARVEVAAAAPAATGPTAAQRYRAALELLQGREFQKADAMLGEAIALDPRLAVAYAARASARFGLGRYRDAADDYRAALGLDANLATPLYGLAECYRVLGDSKHAAEMYQRYAESGAADVRGDLRAIAAKRAQELR